MNDVCSIELLRNAVARGLSADEEAALHAHLEHCEACCAQMEQLAGGEAWQQEAAALLSADELEIPAAGAEKGPGLEKPLDRKNARAVVEAYVSAALAGRIDEAASLAKNAPADAKQIEGFSKELNVQRLAMKSVYVNDPAKPVTALATSEVVKLTKKQPDGQRDGFLVLTLTMSEAGWFVTDIDFESEESADRELKKFLGANPKSIGVPPLTAPAATKK